MELYDLIIIGAGISGLVAARDAAHRGAKIKIVEARDRVGGQIWCIPHTATAKSLALGAEWLNASKHIEIFKEFANYDILVDSNSSKNQYFLYGGKGEKATIHEIKVAMETMKKDPLFVSAMSLINRDISFIVFKDGFNQPDSEHYDMPFEQYLTNRLNLPQTSPVYEFLTAQTFHITGGNPHSQSALGVLYVLAGYRTAEKAFSVNEPLLYRYPEALSKLLVKLVDDITAHGGSIDFNKPVVSVRKEEVMLPPVRVANYDYPPLQDRTRTVHVKCASKEVISARSVLVAVPIKCITSILFDPPLPHALALATERCNAGVDQMKMFVFAAGISHDIGRLLTVQYECRDNYTIAKHHRHNPHAVYSTTGSGAGSVSKQAAVALAAAAAATQSPATRGRRTLTVAYKKKDESSPDAQLNHTLVCTNGSRHELLNNVARNMRKIYPVIELPNDKLYVTPSSSRPSTGKASETSEYSANSNTTTATKNVTTAYIFSHDGTVIYHDFLTDIFSRGTWFNLRAGTADLHAQASKAAACPWHIKATSTGHNSRVEDAYASPSRTTAVAAPYPPFVDLSLIIIGGELHPEWTGWVEGAVRAGAQAVERVIPYLFPPMVERNFMKQLSPIAPAKLESVATLPAMLGVNYSRRR